MDNKQLQAELIRIRDRIHALDKDRYGLKLLNLGFRCGVVVCEGILNKRIIELEDRDE